MSRLNPPARAVNPIPIEPDTPWEREQRQLLGVRIGRTYSKSPSPTATSARGLKVIAGTKVGGGGRLHGSAGFTPTVGRPMSGS